MKKSYLVLALLCVSVLAFSQAKKPTIMVVPSDAWCIKNDYKQTFDNQGKIVTVPDYRMALQNSTDLLLVISKINELMTERGFPLKNLEGAMKTLENQAAEDAMLTSKEGSQVAESPIDKLKKTAKADILMQITWSINKIGPKTSLTFNLQGLDAYTDKQVAGASGTSAPTFSTELPILLEEAVVAHLDNFNAQLQEHFDDLFVNGREIIVRIKAWDSLEDGLEAEINGKLLSEIIEEWMAEHTVQGRFNTTDATENMMLFEQVRIPLFNDKNRAIDARTWVRDLQKYLRDFYQIDSKLMMQGLGQAQLVIGEK